MTQGKIADILQMRGDLDGALTLHGERLDVAHEMQDAESIAHIQFSRAQIRLARNEHEGPGIQTIYEELAEAFGAALKIQRPDAIGPIGSLLGQILAAGGQRDQARQVLEAAANAFATLGQEEMVAQVRAVIKKVGG